MSSVQHEAGSDDGAAERQARQVIAAIGVRARDRNLSRVTELDDGVQAAGRGALSEEARLRLVDVAHQLVGSAGTFGFARVSEAAREIELVLEGHSYDDPDVLRAARVRLEGIRRDLHEDPDLSADD